MLAKKCKDIDAMFGYWANCLVNQPTLETPEPFRLALSKQFPDTCFSILHSVRDWKDFFNGALVKMGGMGQSVGSAHAFTFIKRRDYHSDTHGEPTKDPSFSDPESPDDVLLLVRKYIHSPELSQPPLVAIPATRVAVLKSQPAPRVLPRGQYNKAQQDALKASAAQLEAFPFYLTKAAAYLRGLASGSPSTCEGDATLAPLPDILYPAPVPSATEVWEAPRTLVELPDNVKLITAKAVRDKKALETKRKRGRGQLATLAPPSEAPESVEGVDMDLDVSYVDENGDIDLPDG